MCLIAFAHDVGDYVLAIAANRDEDYRRATLPAHAWTDARDVYGGRDVVAGGTWLGISTKGRVAAVTNVRRFGAGRGSKSRGALCREFLVGTDAAPTYALAVSRERAHYGGFNLLVHDGRTLCYVSDTIPTPIAVTPGIHAISNAALDDPWPKVERTKRALNEALDRDPAHLVEAMFDLLASRDGAADPLLPNTGYDLAIERQLASVFIVSPNYGTRSSTVLLWRRDGRVTFEERSFGPAGVPMGVVQNELSIAAEGSWNRR